MVSTSHIVFAGIAPHPPIMVPEVGGEAIVEVRGSIDAMSELTRRVIASGAETLVLISPHAPLDPRAFVAYNDAQLYGDFSRFRAPGAVVEALLDIEMQTAIARAASRQGYEMLGIEGYDLDHGTAVPLYFLQRNGWHGPVVALGYSYLSNEDHRRFGQCIHRAAEEVGRRVAFIASGDLSHRLRTDAPAGYNPQAHLFDEEVVAAISSHEPGRIAAVDPDLRRLAGECGYRSMLVALGVAEGANAECEVLHYEAPFGVGYLVAQIARARETGTEEALNPRTEERVNEKEEEEDAAAELPLLARRAVETFVREGRVIEAQAKSDALSQPAACFVSIKTEAGDLRGCIGTIEPLEKSLAEELIANAVKAATRDPRFPPVKLDELQHLRYSVDVLSNPEPTQFEDLDPALYGVIVEDESGTRRGLLLPDLTGVETARQQVDIAQRKAGIWPGAPVRLFRFRVERFREKALDAKQND